MRDTRVVKQGEERMDKRISKQAGQTPDPGDLAPKSHIKCISGPSLWIGEGGR